MHPQLASVVAAFRAAEARLHRLADRVPADRWSTRPDPARWSVAECVEHLNLTGRAYLPILHAALAEARALGGPPPTRYRRDPLGWLLWRTMGPPVRIKTKTIASFVPTGGAGPDVLIAEFDRLQREQIACVEAADGLPLGRVRVTSPFDARVKYNLYACLTMLPPHQERHIWQAEKALGG